MDFGITAAAGELTRRELDAFFDYVRNKLQKQGCPSAAVDTLEAAHRDFIDSELKVGDEQRGVQFDDLLHLVRLQLDVLSSTDAYVKARCAAGLFTGCKMRAHAGRWCFSGLADS